MLIFVAKKYYNTYCNSKEDVDKYVNAIKVRLLSYLEDCDEIKIK